MEFSVLNYFEGLVFDEIQATLVGGKKITDEDLLQDIACVALNKLPPRYVRYTVDTTFYLEPEERENMARAVRRAVKDAYEYVIARPRDAD